MQTLLLDTVVWDLCLDANGDIAVASDPYSLAQDAASAIRTFIAEVYYDTTLGIPYFETILGQFPSLEYMRAQFVAAALTVPEVVSAVVFFTGLTGRTLTGQVQVSNTAGQTAVASF